MSAITVRATQFSDILVVFRMTSQGSFSISDATPKPSQMNRSKSMARQVVSRCTYVVFETLMVRPGKEGCMKEFEELYGIGGGNV